MTEVITADSMQQAAEKYQETLNSIGIASDEYIAAHHKSDRKALIEANQKLAGLLAALHADKPEVCKVVKTHVLQKLSAARVSPLPSCLTDNSLGNTFESTPGKPPITRLNFG